MTQSQLPESSHGSRQQASRVARPAAEDAEVWVSTVSTFDDETTVGVPRLVDALGWHWYHCAPFTNSELVLNRPLVSSPRSPRKGPLRFQTEGRRSMTKSVLAFVYCVQLFRFIELYWVVYFSVSFGFVYSRDIFRVEGFPLQRPDWGVIYCYGLWYAFPTRNIVNFLIDFTF